MNTAFIAHIKYLKIAPRKARLLGDSLKGLPVREAEAVLLHRPQRAAGPLLKLLRSAIANARQTNPQLQPAALVVRGIRVDQGPVLKRSLPRAMGRATPILKRQSHVMITLSLLEVPAKERFVIAPPVKKEKKPAKFLTCLKSARP